jgi:hypothetical protein
MNPVKRLIEREMRIELMKLRNGGSDFGHVREVRGNHHWR